MADAGRSTIGAGAAMSVGDLLARERRARLLAERRLQWMRGELMRVNASLDAHARSLADELRPLRRAADAARIAGSRLHDVFEASADGYAIWDAQLRLAEANAPYLRPYDGLEEVRPGIRYRRLMELCADEGIVDIGAIRPADWVASMEACLSEERPEPMVLRLWDGSCLRLTNRRTANGDLVSLAVDITDELETEAELEEVRHRAEMAGHAKATLLSNMTHELRTPLGGILSMSQLLAEEALNDDQREQLAVIQASGEALLSIVDDVLDLGRMEGERMSLNPAPFDPRAVLGEVARALGPLAMRKGLAFEAAAADGVPERVVGDAVRVRQALLNLAANAVKFTEAGQVTIRLEETGRPSRGVSRLAVTVQDTGIGIARGDLERILSAFEQAESGRSRRHDGAGLGLTVTHRLVQLMGGDLRVESELGRGSTFAFTIDLPVASSRAPIPGTAAPPAADPAAPGAEPAPGDTAPPMPTFGSLRMRDVAERPAEPPEPGGRPEASGPDAGPDGGEGKGMRRMRVLAAEDNRANRLILKRMLAGLDIELTLVEDGLQAVEAFSSARPDLILMDISMPGMDGMEATRRIRATEAGARLPIVAMTAHTMSGDEDTFRAAGLDVYLPKPMRKDKLKALLVSRAPADARSPDAQAAG